MDFMKNVALVLCLIFLLGCLKFSVENNDLKAFDINQVNFDDQTYPIAILGSGIGGLTASIYLAQANIETFLVQGDLPGGALTMSQSVRNWPSEIDISGKDLTQKIENQALKNGVKFISGEVESVDFSNWPYTINLKIDSDRKTIKVLSCIIAMGATPNFLNIPGEEEYWGKGVSNCAICDGSLYKNKTVAIVGGGNSAITEGLYLADIAKEVYVLVRKDSLRVSGKFIDELLAKSNVKIFYNTQIQKIQGDNNKVTNLNILNNKTNEEQKLEIDGLFLAIGSTPNSKIFEKQLELDSQGYIILKNNQETSKLGIYAVGDIADPEFKQAILAAGNGCKAALQAINFLKNIGYSNNLLKLKKEKLEIIQKPTEAQNQKQESVVTPKEPWQDKLVYKIKNEKEFNQIIKSKSFVVADFYATWCMPCKKMLPVIEKLAQNHKDKIQFIKVNVDNNGMLARKYNVFGVPTFILIKNGEEKERFTGARDYNYLKNLIDQIF
ncbi:thioredoxin [Candidatus Babeliales bacterium]|nr:thioredoxin [Candidatus Babeliales bacterium]